MSHTISIGTFFSDLYILYITLPFETSGTASCGSTGKHTVPCHDGILWKAKEYC